jgi:hypothetical protein
MAKEITNNESAQAKLDNAAAEGDRARKKAPSKRTPGDVKAIKRFLRTIGTPTKSWQKEETRYK